MSGENTTVQQDTDPYKGEREGKLREVGGQAVWSLSSCKPGIMQALADHTLFLFFLLGHMQHCRRQKGHKTMHL